MKAHEKTPGSSCNVWAVCAFAVALLGGVAGCGREEFLPSAPGDFEPRTVDEDVLVLDDDAPDMKEYQRIGSAMITTKKDSNALKGCRAVAAENGGDAVLSPQSKGPKEWKCIVLRRRDKFTSDN